MYSSYKQYTANGGKLDEQIYNSMSVKAAAEIDCRTFNRASKFKSEIAQKLALCECEIIDVLYAFSSLPSYVTSESNDGYSISYSHTATDEMSNQINTLIEKYLTYPVNLLYGGLMPCDFE